MAGSDDHADPGDDETHGFLIRRGSEDDTYSVWRIDPGAKELLTELPLDAGATFPRSHRLAAVGDYLLAWGPLSDGPSPSYPYRLSRFDPTSRDPLGADAHLQGAWSKKKFYGYRSHYGPRPDESEHLNLIPLTSFVLSFFPAPGRGTYELWNFDPRPDEPGDSDPIPAPYTGQGAFATIQDGHELIPMGDYVLDWVPSTGEYRVWSFDPQNGSPLAEPAIQRGAWTSIDARHQLVALGDRILDWVPEDRSYRLWDFDPGRADPLHGPLHGPLREGLLPEGFTSGSNLTSVSPTLASPSAEAAATPGTIEFMRARISHVVYYMLESRSLDNICGWLYETDQQGRDDIHFVGSSEPFEGASTDYANDDCDGQRVHLSKYRGGKLSEEWNLAAIDQDPFHGYTDALRQMFSNVSHGYRERAQPDMGGFVKNNASPQVMETFSPEQAPILNGLARAFGISDAWFSSVPGGTDINRAYAATGSAFGELSTFEGGDAYAYWPKSPHRQSIWKVLWSNGITDWKIYNAIEWLGHVFTYQLYLQGQIPSVDADPSKFVASLDRFEADARAGRLPAFSFLEPVWIAPSGTTSYHPGGDLVPGETAPNEIYNALRSGPAWEETLLVITFDKNGGIYDHVPPPYASKAWPNDVNDGFHYDLLGPRVPTILVSPWIKKQTVFRSPTSVPYDSTSFLATLLKWYGIPRSRWGLGDRTRHAPTFEGVFLESSARGDAPTLTPPYDKDHPR